MSSQHPHQTRSRGAWYLAPVIFSIIGGIIGYLALKNKEKQMANRLLAVGIVVFVVEASLAVAVPALTVYSSISIATTTLQPPQQAGIQATTTSPEQLIIDRYTFPDGGPLTLTLRNAGTIPENLQNATYSVNGIRATASPMSCTGESIPSDLLPGVSCVVIVSLPLATLYPEGDYPFKIVAPTGTVFLYYVYYGISG